MSEAGSSKTHWWTWVQFLALVASIVVNVFLFVNKTRLEKQIRRSDYNDLSWTATTEFVDRMTRLTLETDTELKPFLQKVPPLESSWLPNVQYINRLWQRQAEGYLKELRSKLDSYQAVVDDELPAVEFANGQVSRFTPPSARALRVLEIVQLLPLLFLNESSEVLELRQALEADISAYEVRFKEAWGSQP